MDKTKNKVVLAVMATAVLATGVPVATNAATTQTATPAQENMNVSEYLNHLKRASTVGDYEYYRIVLNGLQAQYGKSFSAADKEYLDLKGKEIGSDVALKELSILRGHLFKNPTLVSSADMASLKQFQVRVDKGHKGYATMLTMSKDIENLYLKKEVFKELRFSERILFTPDEANRFKDNVRKLPLTEQKVFFEDFDKQQYRLLEKKVELGVNLVKSTPDKELIKEVKADLALLKPSSFKAMKTVELSKLEKFNRNYSQLALEDRVYIFAKANLMKDEMLTPKMKSAISGKLQRVKATGGNEYVEFISMHYAGKAQEKMMVLYMTSGVFLEDYEGVMNRLSGDTKTMHSTSFKHLEAKVKDKVISSTLARYKALQEIPNETRLQGTLALAELTQREAVRKEMYTYVDDSRAKEVEKMIIAYQSSGRKVATEKGHIEREIAKISKDSLRSELTLKLNTVR